MRRLQFFMIGALCGAAIGAAASLLMTPASGDALRDEARLQFDDMMAEARRAAEKRGAELERELEQLTHPPAETSKQLTAH